MRHAAATRALALATAALAAAGCGGAAAPPHARTTQPTTPNAQAAELARPALSPPLSRRPAGGVIHVGALPDAVAADPGTHRFAVAIHDPSRLALVDARSGRVLQRVAVPVGNATRGHRPVTPAVFLVPGEFGKRAVAVTPATHTAPDAAEPAATVVFGRTFIVDARAGRVDALDRGRPVAHLAGVVRPAGLASGDFERTLAVVDAGRRALSLYDPRSLRRVATVPAGAGPTNVVAEGDLLYVADTRGDALLTFTTRPRLRLIERLALPGGAPYGLAIDPVRRRLHITLTATNTLVTIATDGSRTPARRRATVRQPDAVAVDSSTATIAVAGRSAGVLQLISPAARRRGG